MDDILQSEESQRFFSLISMLQRSAMMHLGMLPDEEGMIHFNLGEAKAAIDLLDTLQTRTAGNLEDVEENILKGQMWLWKWGLHITSRVSCHACGFSVRRGLAFS